MKVIILQAVEFEGSNYPYTWRKEIETNVVPNQGDYIEDSLWKNPYEYAVCEKVINYSENYCRVTVEKYKDKISSERSNEMAHIAELHGWKALWNY